MAADERYREERENWITVIYLKLQGLGREPWLPPSSSTSWGINSKRYQENEELEYGILSRGSNIRSTTKDKI